MYYPDMSRETRYGTESVERFCNAFSYEIKGFGLKTQNRTTALHQLVLDTYCLLYIVSGSVSITSGKKKTEQFGPHDLLLLEPFKHYRLELLTNNSLSFYQIAFDVAPAYNQAAFLQMVFLNPGSPRLPQDIPDFGPQISALLHSQDADGSEKLLDLHKTIMRHVFSANSTVRELPSLRMTSERELAKRALEYIHAHLRLPLKVSDVSSYLDISDSYLYKAFLHLVAVPPGRYILREKAKAAARMLCVDRLSIGQVASSLGYSSLFHFSKSFKSIYGLSPRSYTKAVLRREYIV